MKKTTKYALLFTTFVLISGIFICINLCLDSSSKNIISLCKDVTKSLLTSLIVTVLIGTFTKIISDDIIKIQKNDKKLRQYGVYDIGTGNSSHNDIVNLFGDNVRKIYPIQVDLLFLSGCLFLEEYKEQIIEAVANGTNVRILTVSPIVNGKPNGYIERYSNICEGKKTA